jgi:hypothetical protein
MIILKWILKEMGCQLFWVRIGSVRALVNTAMEMFHKRLGNT